MDYGWGKQENGKIPWSEMQDWVSFPLSTSQWWSWYSTIKVRSKVIILSMGKIEWQVHFLAWFIHSDIWWSTHCAIKWGSQRFCGPKNRTNFWCQNQTLKDCQFLQMMLFSDSITEKNWPVPILYLRHQESSQLPRTKHIFETLQGKLQIIYFEEIVQSGNTGQWTPVARFNMAAQILFWHENYKVSIIPNLQVSLMGFQKFFFCQLGWF